MIFTSANTVGFTAGELASLNAEWDAIAKDEGLVPDTDEYLERSLQHAVAVSNGTHKPTPALTTIEKP